MLGIFGGTFDPVHFGHINVAISLLENYPLEQIRFVPCQISPFKKELFASAEHRLNMLEIVTRSNSLLVVDDRELQRPGQSFTIDTVNDLRSEFGSNESINLIMGMDAFSKFCAWKNYQQILTLSNLMILQRPGYQLPKSGCEQDIFNKYHTKNINDLAKSSSGHMYLCEDEEIDISSTQIREIIKQGIQPKYLVPGTIWNYISRNKLYVNSK